jgi:protease-4
MEQQPKKRWIWVIIILLGFAFLSLFVSAVFSLFSEVEPEGNVAVIPVKGVIRIEGDSPFGAQTAGSTEIVKQIRKADAKPSIKAILLDINSPGGSAVASKEIADAVKKTNKTTVAVIREVGASGGYWVASSADHVIANEMSITGSIGVISSYIEYAGLLKRYNMSYQRIIAGKYKDIGDPFTPLNSEERTILQKKINKIHDIFIKEISVNRNMPEENIRKLATGEFYLGIEALDYGLIDATGDKETAKAWLKQKLNISEIKFAEYGKPKTFLSLLRGVISKQSFAVGEGIGAKLKETSAGKKFEIYT